MKFLSAVVALALFCSAAIADTHTYTFRCWNYFSPSGSMSYAIGDGYQVVHYENYDGSSRGLDWGWIGEFGTWWAQEEQGTDIRGVDQGQPATFYVFVLANPLDPTDQSYVVVMAVQDDNLVGPPAPKENSEIFERLR